MTEEKALAFGQRLIGPQHPAYIVAELSANHNHDLDRALRLVDAAAESGADAVKLQTYTPDTITLDCDRHPFRIRGTIWEGRTLHELYGEAYTPWEWHAPLQARAREVGLDFFSSPFDHTAVDFLEDLGVPAYKIASFELVDLPLIRRVARTGKPMILSTGMATVEEIEEAVVAARLAGCSQLALLKCTSSYPSPPEEMHLRTIPDLSRRFGVVAGLSDHSMETAVPVAAVALGACIIEKHFTLARADGGPDSSFSLEPEEFAEMVRAVRTTEAALGEVRYGPKEAETETLRFRRSLFVVEDIEAGERLTCGNIRSIRPGHGLHTRHLDEVLGRKAAIAVQRGTPLAWDLLQ